MNDKILNYLFSLNLDVSLPEKVEVLNPYSAASFEVKEVVKKFYNKFYSNKNKRKLILGINPGRLGAGSTGIPFTDTKRLNDICQIKFKKFALHEPSSVFIYEMIKQYGGVESFYSNYFISSVCPLGFVKKNNKANLVNYNYYDELEFFERLKPYLIQQLKIQINWGLDTTKVFCLGTGKNFKYLNLINKEANLFNEIIPLEHPRYIMQYKSKSIQNYIEKYLNSLQ